MCEFHMIVLLLFFVGIIRFHKIFWWIAIEFAFNYYKRNKDSFEFPRVEEEGVELLNS